MSKCILCNAELPSDPIMTCNNMPASAQDIPNLDELNEDSGIDLNLYQCIYCGLVQFDCEPVSYYKDVIRSGGYSTTMSQLRRTQYKHLIDKYNLTSKKIIEIGCGQGEFLQTLTEFPVACYGIENKTALVKLGRLKNLSIEQDFAENGNHKIKNAPFDAFLSFNFLEHQPKPNDMLQCIYNNLAEDGIGLVTVPSFEYILENNSFYELIRDHIANYTEETLCFLFEKNGFQVLEKERINRDTISIIVKKRKPVDVSGLKNNFSLLKNQLNSYIDTRITNNKKIAVWGASHQSFTALSTLNIQSGVAYIIDSAPFKQNKYAPSSHIPIVAPEHFFKEPVDCILIIAPGYTDEISEIIQNRFGNHVEIAYLKSANIEFI